MDGLWLFITGDLVAMAPASKSVSNLVGFSEGAANFAKDGAVAGLWLFMTGDLVAMAPALAAKAVSNSSVVLVSLALPSEMTATRRERILT
eukprot:scaffold22524_cov39-Cylindrotheca_fusiformis.AAC.1